MSAYDRWFADAANALDSIRDYLSDLEATRTRLDLYRRELPHESGAPTRMETDTEVIDRLHHQSVIQSPAPRLNRNACVACGGDEVGIGSGASEQRACLDCGRHGGVAGVTEATP